MLKFIIISLLLIYLVARFAGFFFRVVYWLFGKPQARKFERNQQQPPQQYQTWQQNGMKIFMPKHKRKQHPAREEDYVNYEEVKDKE